MRAIFMGLHRVCLGLLAVAGLSVAADAATLSYTANFAATPTDLSGSGNYVTIAQFDPTLGILSSVVVSMTETVSGKITVIPDSTVNGVSFNPLAVNSAVLLLNPFANLGAVGCDYIYADCFGAELTGADAKVLNIANATYYASTDLSFSGATATSGDTYSASWGDNIFSSSNSGVLSNYTGTGSENYVLLTAATLDGIQTNGGTLIAATNVSASVTVEYTYTVPEPGSVAVFGAAMLGLGAVLRRRKGKPVQA